jgi:tetratricopeptide (TPR) repeat protein
VASIASGLPAFASEEAVARFERAAAQFPDDRDLSWALAQARHDAGQREQAVDQLRAHLKRWPQDPPDGWLVLGQRLLELRRDEEAELALERALVADPSSAAAHVSLGLVLRRQGRLEEAERHYRMAARLETELQGEALLLASLVRLELGDEMRALDGLQQVVALDPDSEAARNARLVLDGNAAPRPKPLRIEAVTGFQFDSNVTLESDQTEFAGSASDREDFAYHWGTQLHWRAHASEQWSLELGGRYDENAHLDVSELDMRRIVGLLSARYRPSERWLVRLDSFAGPTYLDGDSYLWSGAIRPSVFAFLGPRWGALRLYAEGERLSFEDDPSLAALERDGWSYGAGLEHFGSFSEASSAWFSTGVGYTRRDTEAERDGLLRFDGAYDHDRWRGLVRTGGDLLYDVKVIGEVQFTFEDYDHENLVDLLTDNGGLGDPTPSRRSDRLWSAGLRVSRPLTSLVEAELSWSFTDRSSNVDVFDYDRHIAGLAFRVRTP